MSRYTPQKTKPCKKLKGPCRFTSKITIIKPNGERQSRVVCSWCGRRQEKK